MMVRRKCTEYICNMEEEIFYEQQIVQIDELAGN